MIPACRPQEATAEVTRDEPTVSHVSSVNDLLLIVAPIAGEYVGPLQQQPSLMAVDEQVRQRCQTPPLDLQPGPRSKLSRQRTRGASGTYQKLMARGGQAVRLRLRL